MQSFLRRLYPNIDLRITLPFLLVIVVTAVIAVFIVTRLTASTIQERLNNQLVSSAQNAEDSLALIEEDYLAALRLMTFTEGVDQAIIDSNRDQLQRTLRGIVANANLDDVIVFNTGAEPLVRIRSAEFASELPEDTTILSDALDWEAVQQVLADAEDSQGDKFAEIITYDTTTVFYIVAPVKNAQAEIVGGIAAGISETTLTRVLRNQALAEIVLYFPDGEIIAASFPESATAPAIPATVQTADLSQPLTTAPIEEFTVDTTPYQFLFTDLELRSRIIGVLSVALPVDFIVGQLNNSRNTFVLLFAILVLTIMVLGFVIAQSIIRPVFHMVSTTRAIRSGDLSRRVGLRIPDELGELSESFDHMTDQLVQRNQEINELYLQQVRETARRTAMLKSIDDILIVMDNSNDVLLMNHSARTFIQQLETANNPEDTKMFWDICQNPSGYRQSVTLRLLDYDLNVIATPIHTDDGERLGHVVVMRDITSILDAERLKDEMILQLSHELRTPLSAARGYSELAKMLEGDQQTMYIEKSVAQIDLLGDMVNRVIEVSVMLSGRLTLDIEPFDVTKALHESIEQYRPAIEEADLELNLLIPDRAIELEGDREQLKKVFGHIIQNAVYYTLSGWIEVTLRQLDTHHVAIFVTDSGVGIEADEQEKVFERMYRGRSADAGPTDQRGLGLGLFISREIIDAHSGRIVLVSKPETGTEVGIKLPLMQPEGTNGSSDETA